jgi:hypothetical protein
VIFGMNSTGHLWSPFDHENGVWLMARPENKNYLPDQVIDPFKMTQSGEWRFPGVQTKAQFTTQFPYDVNGNWQSPLPRPTPPPPNPWWLEGMGQGVQWLQMNGGAGPPF